MNVDTYRYLISGLGSDEITSRKEEKVAHESPSSVNIDDVTMPAAGIRPNMDTINSGNKM